MMIMGSMYQIICLFMWANAVAAINHIKTSSLLTCMDNSGFTASFFDVIFFPNNRSVQFDIQATSTISENVYVGANITVVAYGLKVIEQSVDFCSFDLPGICPFQPGHLDIQSGAGNNLFTISQSVADRIPGIAYTIPDLDATVRVVLYDTNNTETPLACVQAVLSNGKTVQTKYASWPIAAISGLGLITSGVISIIGHSSTAAHIASNSMSLFIYFQSLAITAMQAVAKVPPIAAAWAQNFQWSLGIVKVGFVQDISNWYVQSTGGIPTDILSNSYLSIAVQKAKRGLLLVDDLFKTSSFVSELSPQKRSITADTFITSDNFNATLYTTNEKDPNIFSKTLILRGIQRVSYLAGIEITDLFMTSVIFLLFFCFVLVVCLSFFKAIIEILIRAKIMNEGKFHEYRQQWSHVVKGTIYRLMLVALPQIGVMCIWELTTRDSAGTVVIAVFLLIICLLLLIYASVRVIIMGRHSVRQYKNPAYLLFGDGKFLNRFGFIYVQFRADHYWFIGVSLVYIFLKSLFVAAMQKQGQIQSIIVFAIELVYCVVLCWKRPFMDKRTNVFNIIISIINTINALFFCFFSNIFRQPAVVSSVMAVIYFVLNAAFALFLLIFTIVTCTLALIYKNPDTRYQPMKDDRVSFLPRFENPKGGNGQKDGDDYELMALGATAMKGHEHSNPMQGYDDDESAFEDESAFKQQRRNLADNPGGSSSFSNGDSKRDSLYLESIEPTQATSTIVGNPSNVQGGFNTGYGHSAFTTPANQFGDSKTSFSLNGNSGNAYSKNTGFNNMNRGY